MMIKFLLGVAMVAFTSFCGYVLTKKYRKRKQFFTQLCVFNERFLSEIRYYRRPVKEFAYQYAYKGEFQEFLHYFFQTIDEERVLNVKEIDFLKPDEKNVVEDYFLMIGKGDSASQYAYFSGMRERLSTLKNQAETACKKYGDLYIKLGFLCGLLILILMI